MALLSHLSDHISPQTLKTRLRKHDLLRDGEEDGAVLDRLLLSLSRSEWESEVLKGLSLGVRRRVWNAVQEYREASEAARRPNEGTRRRQKQKGFTKFPNLPSLTSSSESSSEDDDRDHPDNGTRLLSALSDDTEDGSKHNTHHLHRHKKKSKKNAQGELANGGVNHMAQAAQTSNGLNGNSSNGRLGKTKHVVFASNLQVERTKALLAFVYGLGVSWLSAFVMVIVHDRVPDMEKYPPLPDILLDNLPHIPWAFEMCELTGMVLMALWGVVCLFHKHRFILLRRFFNISGTIFLLRCVTMLLTSLSVPGKHLECAPRPYGDIWNKLYNAYVIWTGAGMTLQGVRTCGDYMFSGHTVSLTLLNFFITEYTSRKIHFLHTFTWICNVFGIFFILAAHEHYSIDVFIAFYISSRLFLYYHTLANNKGLGKVGQRAWFYFPLFYFFESNIDGKVPNEFEWPITFDDVTRLSQKIKAKLTTILYLTKAEKAEDCKSNTMKKTKKTKSY